jgi:isoleucyl-tRNA synthetase
MKLKDTLSLPRTDFPMKAQLPVKEPERLKAWAEADLEGAIRRARAGKPRFVLHDGPPYANGHVHLGTALNKILKDFVLKSRSQAGFDTPYVPGWDCHGMPIEHAVLKEAKVAAESLAPAEVRRRCAEFAARFVDIHRVEFQRLGVLGDWNDPYLTYDKGYETAVVGAFRKLFDAGYIYKGLRSIHWCPTCRTALANAEVEHDPAHESISIHVRFPVAPGGMAKDLGIPEDAALLAWTTTPWTIPANVALAVHPDLEYALVGGDARHAIVAWPLLPRVAAEVGWKDAPVLKTWRGKELEGLRAVHPQEPRDAPVVLADYVTTDAGTGVVHTAPGHGMDDFETGRKYGLPVLVPVDKAGRFTAAAGRYAGRHVFEANADVARDLAAAGAVIATGKVVHSYPTCWRCHGPVIFLATEQWFLRIDHDRLRDRSLSAIDETTWTPAWGHDRIHDSVSVRPDWCLSRQRAWGVPIPTFECAACGKPVVTAASLARAEEVFREGGSEAWLAKDIAEIAPPGLACESCGGSELVRDANILDVWFDSACSHLAVLAGTRWKDMSWPADMYLEGVDQHRGWFQVSLLTGVAIKGAAPFRHVFTHGLVLDDAGRKMSKSLGNVVSPDEVLGTQGGDVLRLFFASVDATADIRFSKQLLDAVSDSYRKIRNTLRFLMGNLSGFDPERDAPTDDLVLPTDRYALNRLREVSRDVRAAYGDMQFNRATRLVQQYLVTDVSAFQAHVTKDRLYCEAPGSLARRSAQAVLFEIARECCQLLAPILCFTADEAWEHLPSWPGRTASVHEATWRELPPPSMEVLAEWAEVLAFRDEALKALEKGRSAGLIGDPLEAAVRVHVTGALRVVLERRLESLPEVLVVSSVALAPEGEREPEGAHHCEALPGAWIAVTRASGAKCPRCWRYRDDHAGVPNAPDLCGRCTEVVTGLGVTIDAA